ncbi:probable E3 ubiquitin-protein ligase HERC1 isoform X2 [Cheilinus undulatus]|nr:probable E3 ubiquitin-protein ligase HERC1 isoform X2 [Cheilinus undulatus]XP_041643464.1 probable E3 ubiquitin-protein ligase HERC1 isoform X2 [Cheilinus undulatus]
MQCDLDMDLLCWGSGKLGQSGHGRLKDVHPVEAHMKEFTAVGLGRVKLMACGSSHCIVITEANNIFAWGNGTSGQLGDGEKSIKDHPVEVRLPQDLNTTGSGSDMDAANVVGVACGSRHSFIWSERGQAYSFGNNFYAQLGYDFQRADFKEHQLAPRLFQNLPSSLKISQVACGERHTLFVLEDGSVAACGQNDYGQIGSGSNENAVVPHFVEPVAYVSKVTCGANHNLALTDDGRLFQWGCGRACGDLKRNILFPEEVTLPISPVRGIAAGCWHSLFLTDGGNVFSWGMGQEGQLGLGEDRIHSSIPYLLSYSQLAEVTQIQAGDSYSAAVTAGGELLLWGQIPCMSWVSDHTGLKRIWTPQPVPLAGRKVHNVACGTWHMMALTTCSLEKNGEYPHPETKADFRDLVSNPVPMEHTEKENTEHDSRQAQHKPLQGLKRPDSFEKQEKHGESESPVEGERYEDRPNTDERIGALHESEFSIPRSSLGIDRRGNSRSSIKSDQRAERKNCRSAGPWEQRKEPCRSSRSRDIVFTTLHLLPKWEGEQSRPTTGILPRLQPGQKGHGTISSVARKGRSAPLTEPVEKSGSDSSNVLNTPRLRPKPRPPGRCPDHADQREVLCRRSRFEVHTDINSPVYNSSPCPSPGQHIQMSPLFDRGLQVKTSLSPTPPSSEPLRYCPTHRRAMYSSGTSWKNL